MLRKVLAIQCAFTFEVRFAIIHQVSLLAAAKAKGARQPSDKSHAGVEGRGRSQWLLIALWGGAKMVFTTVLAAAPPQDPRAAGTSCRGNYVMTQGH